MNVIYCFFAELLCKKNHGGVRRGAFGRRLSFVALTLGVLFCAFFSCVTVYAEGSREIIQTSIDNAKALGVKDPEGSDASAIARWSIRSSDSANSTFMGVATQQKMKFYAYEGEVVLIASSSVGKDVDVIIHLPNGSSENIDLGTDRTTEMASNELLKTDTNRGADEYAKTVKPGTGQILNRAAEKAGPKGVKMPKGDGTYEDAISGEDAFTPYVYEIKHSGIYEVEFKADNCGKYKAGASGLNYDRYPLSYSDEFYSSGSTVHAWDITVAKKSNDEYLAVNGRVWADAFSLQTNGSDASGIYANLYAVTRDGYIWKFGLNGCKPYTISFYSNSRGNIGSGTNASAYHSVHSPLANYTAFDFYKNLKDKNGNPDGVYILGPDNEVTDIDSPYHMFFNYPDTSMPESIILTKPKDIGKITSLRYDGRTGEDSEDKGNEDGYSGVGGYFEIGTDGVSSYQIVIDMSNMYAKKYHNENKESCTDAVYQDDAICLSVEGDENFIYQDPKDSKWYSIRTTDKSKRHPSNENGEKLEDLIIYEPITKPANLDSDYKSLGKVMLGNAAVDGKTDRIKWNGRDHYGRILPIGTYFGDTGRGTVYVQAKAGEIHFPLCDVERAQNGFSIWLENAPDWMKKAPNGDDLDLTEQIKSRSKLYFNNLDESLLRDFCGVNIVPTADNGSKWGNANMAWVWNLPRNISISAAGQKSSNAEKTNRQWVEGEAVFEDKSLDGVPSYEYSGAGKGSVDDRVLTKNAAVATSDGIDHGIADMWSYAISNKESDKFYLKDEIQLDNYANHRIITGFVYLDTPKTTTGTYDKTTDDRELPLAEVTARYGDFSPTAGALSNLVNRIAGGYTNEYTTTTNTNGYYSIPIDMNYFSAGADKKEVEITVKYIDPNMSNKDADHTTYKVTTLGTAGTADRKYAQTSGGAANISVQTIDLGTIKADLREIYADNVGYTYSNSKNLLIEDTWEPEALKDITLSSKFKIVGVLESVAEAYEGGDTTPEEIEAKNKYFEEHAFVVPFPEVSVDAALGGIFTTTDLPGCIFKADGTNGEDIVYRVIQIKEGTYETKIEHTPDHPYYGDEVLYDYWHFTNSIVPSTFIMQTRTAHMMRMKSP